MEHISSMLKTGSGSDSDPVEHHTEKSPNRCDLRTKPLRDQPIKFVFHSVKIRFA